MSSAIRIGVVGCGRILNAHLRGFRILQENGLGDLFRITALCARKTEDARRFRTIIATCLSVDRSTRCAS